MDIILYSGGEEYGALMGIIGKINQDIGIGSKNFKLYKNKLSYQKKIIYEFKGYLLNNNRSAYIKYNGTIIDIKIIYEISDEHSFQKIFDK